MKAIINTNIFTMRTVGCEVEVTELGGQFVSAKIVTQPNKHSKAPKVGTTLKVSVLNIDYVA